MKTILCTNSKLNNEWIIEQPDYEYINSIVINFNLSYLAASFIANKKISYENIDQFINPSLKNSWLDPAFLPNIEKAYEQFSDAINKKQTIGILGDYDVDGIGSSAMLSIFLNEIGIKSIVWLPSRTDSYGPSEISLKFFQENPVDLLFILDCGTTSFDFVEKYKKPIIIIDHHIASSFVEVEALINPQIFQDINQEYKTLCTCGLLFLFLCFVIQKNHLNKNIINKIADLAALGTVCDVMPIGPCLQVNAQFNRALIKKGLQILERQEKYGLKALIQLSKIKLPFAASDIGFYLGPRLNSSARIKNAYIAFDILTTTQHEKAFELGLQLQTLNEERRTLQEIIFEQAIEEVMKQINSEEKIIIIANENWHAGIVGIVASMVEEKTGKPVIIGSVILNENNETIVKASARSRSINIGNLIIKAVLEKIIQKGGGHKNAGGLSATLEQFENFKQWSFNELSNHSFKNIIEINAICNLSQIQPDIMKIFPLSEKCIILTKNLKLKSLIKTEKYAKIICEQNSENFIFFLTNKKINLIEILEKNLHKFFDALIEIGDKGFNNIIDIN